MTLNKLLLSLLLSLCVQLAVCQEVLTPLQYNPLLAKHGQHHFAIQSRSGDTAISLPFVDDFSYSQKDPVNVRYPNPALWMDSDVYINDGYGVNPPSVGVATFDGLNKYGLPYNTTLFSTGYADSLTSRPINLREHIPADSIYLSFFYQPQGNGDAPSAYDSLLVQFRDSSGSWDEVWSDTGSTVQSFQQVLIPVKDLKYFHPGFQFRFINYATLSGNNNNWNVDYVKMTAGRNDTDFELYDAAMQYNTQSILKNYTQMPWWQFYNSQQTELRDSFSLTIINNYPSNAQPNNINYGDSVFNLVNNDLLNYTVQRPSILIPSGGVAVKKLSTSSVPADISYFDEEGDSVAQITVKTNIVHLADDRNASNDAVYHDQFFYNYYSYDDGTPENAYSLLGNGNAPQLAYGFHVNQPDTIRAIQIFFVWANAADSNDIFDLQVWSSLENAPTYSDSAFYSHVTFGDSLTGNGFHTYILRHPTAVSDSFYIGFLQSGIDPIYVGFDVNDNDSMNLYYNVGNGFQQSQFHGALMMRPILGKALPVIQSGITTPLKVNESLLSIYPNPVKDILNVKIQNASLSDAVVSIENVLGQEMIKTSIITKSPKGDFNIDVNSLPPGMYFVRVTNRQTNNILTAKFIKAN